MADQVSNEDVIGWLGDVAYGEVQAILKKEIYDLQARVFEFGSHDEVIEARGYCKGLAFLVNLRDIMENEMAQEEGFFDEKAV